MGGGQGSGARARGQGGTSLGEQLLEEALLLGLAALGSLLPRALLVAGGGALVQVRVAAHQVDRALDVGKHLHLLHLQVGSVGGVGGSLVSRGCYICANTGSRVKSQLRFWLFVKSDNLLYW